MTLPPKLSTRGGGTTGVPAAVWNQLIDYLKSTRIIPNMNVRPRITSQGTLLSTLLKTARFSSSPKPWDIVGLAGVGEPDQEGKYSSYEASVWPGTVAGIMPSNLFTNGELAKFSVSAELQQWKAKCMTNGKQITGVEIVVDAAETPTQTLVPSALPAEAWFVFGLTFQGATYRTIGSGNPQVDLNQAIATDKTSSPPPGIPGVDRWYQIIFQ